MARLHETIAVLPEDQKALERLLRAPSTPQSRAQRARIILLSAQGQTVEAIASQLGTTVQTVYKWRNRYTKLGLEGLADKPRPGQPRKLSNAKVKEILTLTTERIPQEATHWSLRLMAKYTGVTIHQVREVWKAADLQPHRLRNFKISSDPNFAEKVIDVVGLYLNPPDNAVVLSVDEKTQIQALDRTQPMLPLRPGQVERRTHDYKRHGTTSLYAAFDIATGRVLGRVTRQHRAKEFLEFLAKIDRHVPKELDLHLILDNSSTHKTKEVQAWLAEHPRFKLHFTPTSASWLNAVESWFGTLERRAIHRGVFTSVGELQMEINRFIEAHNREAAKPFKWTKSAEVILDAVQRAKKARN